MVTTRNPNSSAHTDAGQPAENTLLFRAKNAFLLELLAVRPAQRRFLAFFV